MKKRPMTKIGGGVDLDNGYPISIRSRFGLSIEVPGLDSGHKSLFWIFISFVTRENIVYEHLIS